MLTAALTPGDEEEPINAASAEGTAHATAP